MSTRNLEKLFRPRSVAVIGASDRVSSVGRVVMANLLAGGFAGPIMPVNPRRASVAGTPCYADIAALPTVPDLAILCTPPAAVPGLIAELGARGTRAAIVLAAGLGREQLPDGRTLQQAMLDAARPYLLRILGPNCVGALVHGIGLNASFAHVAATPGNIAFVSQSGALCTVILDWARAQQVGFSHFISLGDSADVDFGDVIDYLAGDDDTRAILLYVESVKHARKFMSAARAAARTKPIIAIKAGRTPQAAKAAQSHTGALAGGDDVISAAFARAGIIRVDSTEELFDAAETLSRGHAITGPRLAILTNGGGPGVLAVDAMATGMARLADLSPATMAELDKILPPTWSRGNPVDIIGDAPAERYAAALHPLLADPGVDAILVMHAPTAIVPSDQPALAVIAEAKASAKPVLACWLGRGAVATARDALAHAGIPSYETPTGAVTAFNHLLEYRRTQELLMQVPANVPADFAPDPAAARAVIARAIADGRRLLTEPEAKAVLAAYGLPIAATAIAADADKAAEAAQRIGFPVALKILSRDITHKSDVGGVALNLDDAGAVAAAATAMLARIKTHAPQAVIDGFTVQRMITRPGAYELILGLSEDPIFGPVVLFGQGGVAVEVLRDRAVALPPLNMTLVQDLIDQTRIARLLHGFRDRPAVDFTALKLAVMKVAQIAIDLPEVAELDINPLLADGAGVIALDARIVVTDRASAVDRLAIRPYPKELEEWVALADGSRVLLRPIRPEDEPAQTDFSHRLTPEDIRFRFFSAMKELTATQMARLIHIDYDREMAFIATTAAENGETLGVARIIADPDRLRGEFSLIVRSDMKRRGLGRVLMTKLISYARAAEIGVAQGIILKDNAAMIALVQSLGFEIRRYIDTQAVEAVLDLGRPQ